MPKRRAFGSPAGRIALLHALAHIELNAIDLAWDLIARFHGEPRSRAFFDDWVEVAAEEADTTGYGNRPRQLPTTCSPDLPSCRSCSRRAGSM